MKKKYRYTMGIDPSGAFREGKGTTGWCILDNRTNKLLRVGTISAKNYTSDVEYWDAHLERIKWAHRHYKSLAISIEDYILYKSSAMAQVNSQLETVQLIGIIKHFCYYNDLEVFIRPAVAVKKRWSDDILLFKGIITKIGERYAIPDSNQTICEHERDSIRHAIHFNIFENREETK